MSGKKEKTMGSEVNERIKTIMRLKNISQRELAEALDMSQPALYQRLHSAHTFPIEDLIELAKSTDTSISDIVYEIHEPEPQSKDQIFEEIKKIMTGTRKDVIEQIRANGKEFFEAETKIATEFTPDGMISEIRDLLESILAELKAKK